MKHSENNSILTSMTDLMTSIAVIFILLLVVYLSKTYQETQQGSDNRLNKLITELKYEDIEAQKDPFDPLSFIIRLHDDRLQFKWGSSLINDNGKLYLNTFIPKLTNVLCSNKNDVESLLIQGFTDSTGDDEVNLSLSQQRAFQVLHYSLNKTSLPNKRRACFLELASTNGKGERELMPFSEKNGMFSKAGYENKKESRRVEFRIRVKSMEQKKFINELNKKSK